MLFQPQLTHMYIALWTVDVNVPNPYYGPYSGEPEYVKEAQQRFKRFDTEKEVSDFVIGNQKLQDVRYYLVSKEIFPKLNVTVNVDI